MPNYIEQSKLQFQLVVDHFTKDLQNLRAGRAQASMVETLAIEAYGSTMELKSVASITVPDARTIQIEPWDKNVVKEIEKGILASGLGLNPNTAGTVIRLVIPAMTEENRKNFIKLIGQKAEAARIGLRSVREEVRAKITADEKAKAISEDEKFRYQEQLDKLIVDFNAKIEQLAKDKEKDIMTI